MEIIFNNYEIKDTSIIQFNSVCLNMNNKMHACYNY